METRLMVDEFLNTQYIAQKNKVTNKFIIFVEKRHENSLVTSLFEPGVCSKSSRAVSSFAITSSDIGFTLNIVILGHGIAVSTRVLHVKRSRWAWAHYHYSINLSVLDVTKNLFHIRYRYITVISRTFL